jgi:hypothetical protein
MGIGGMWSEIEGMCLLPRVTGNTESRVPLISEMWMGFVYRTSVGRDDEGGTMPHTLLINRVIPVQRRCYTMLRD